jgi:hypothetical protein
MTKLAVCKTGPVFNSGAKVWRVLKSVCKRRAIVNTEAPGRVYYYRKLTMLANRLIEASL